MRTAADLDAKGKCAEAETYYLRALASGTPSVPLLNNAGNHYMACGQPGQAQIQFERLLRQNATHRNANLQLARLATERKQGARALEYLSHVLDSDPAVRLLRAEASEYAGQHTRALKLLDSVETEAKADRRILFSLGLTCARAGLFERAETAFGSVLALVPASFEVLYNLGRAAARAHHYDRALRALEAAVKLRPAHADALLELGLTFGAAGDSSRSVYVLAQARQRAPKRPDILLPLARAAEDAGYYGDSALAYDEYLEVRPGDDAARRDRGRVYGLTGIRLPEGLKELNWYVRKHPEDPIGFYALAQLTWQEQPQSAYEQLSAALRLDPSFTPARYARGWLLYRLGRIEQALPDLELTVQLLPTEVRPLDQLGLAYLSLDKPAEAEKRFRRALAMAPQDAEVMMHLGRSLMALNRESEAETYLEQFRKLRPQRARDPRREPGMFELATMSQPERARRQIERLREDARTHPGEPELQMHLAGMLLADGQVEEALQAYRELLTANADARVWQQAGSVLLRAGQYRLAREFLRRADSREARPDLAMATLFVDGPEKALEVLGGVAEAKQDTEFFLVKAQVLEAAGRGAEAQELVSKGLGQSPLRPDAAQQGAAFLFRRKRGAEAVQVIGEALKVHRDDPNLLLLQAILFGLTGRVREAEQELKRIEARWPEWDRPYLAHGLLLQSGKRMAEARQKLQVAEALGSAAAKCAGDLAALLGPACR